MHWFVYYSIKVSLRLSILSFWLDCVHYALWVLLPMTGWVDESWLGRYTEPFLSDIMHVHSNSMYINFIAVHVDRIPAFVLAIGIFGIWHIIIIIILLLLLLLLLLSTKTRTQHR